ncbi:hypothetical protein [Methylobacterium sp. J-090]|nr:hypothetical protein [Methylobacterium sp. J-090]
MDVLCVPVELTVAVPSVPKKPTDSEKLFEDPTVMVTLPGVEGGE